MNSKTHKTNSGFMLSEVLIALVVVSTVMMPIMNYISVAVKKSGIYNRKNERFFEAKNLMEKENFFAQEEKSQQKSGVEQKTKNTRVKVKYSRSTVKKMAPFDKSPEHVLNNLVLQKVEVIGADGEKENLILFLYKPKVVE